jgi:hypothetical protein
MANGVYFTVKRRSNTESLETLVARGIELETAAELIFRLGQLQAEHGGNDEYFLEIY